MKVIFSLCIIAVFFLIFLKNFLENLRAYKKGESYWIVDLVRSFLFSLGLLSLFIWILFNMESLS